MYLFNTLQQSLCRRTNVLEASRAVGHALELLEALRRDVTRPVVHVRCVVRLPCQHTFRYLRTAHTHTRSHANRQSELRQRSRSPFEQATDLETDLLDLVLDLVERVLQQTAPLDGSTRSSVPTGGCSTHRCGLHTAAPLALDRAITTHARSRRIQSSRGRS